MERRHLEGGQGAAAAKAMVVSSRLAVSCAVPTRCLAGYPGAVKGGYPNRALAEFFNGESLTPLQRAVPAGAADTDFFAMTLSATRSVAVGAFARLAAVVLRYRLTGFWNGKSWKLVGAS